MQMKSNSRSNKYVAFFGDSFRADRSELWIDDVDRKRRLTIHVRDIRMERQLWCCLERIRWRLALYDKQGVPEHDHSYVRSLRQSESVLEELLRLIEDRSG